MKKLLLLCLTIFSLTANAQTDYYSVISGLSTSSGGRAPQGARPATRSVWIITAAEMAASGFASGSTISSLGFNFSTGLAAATTGSMVIYLENTADATNTKNATWTTAITGMTTVSNSNVTLPTTTGVFDIPFTGGTPFTYTGGALYIAFDYQNFGITPLSTQNICYANTALASSVRSVVALATDTTPPTTLGAASAFRPETRLGTPVLCERPINLGFSNQTFTSAVVNFSISTGGTTELEYGLAGFTPGSGTLVTNVVSPYVISGLTSGTIYQFYVRKDCGAGTKSVWRGSLPFNTLYQPATPTYNSSFEQANLPLIGWTTGNVPALANDWQIGYYPATTLVQEGNYSVYSITPTATAANNWLLSRGINLTAGTPVSASYYVSNYRTINPASTGTSSYQLTVGTSQTVAAQTTILATETGISTAAYTLKHYNFTPTTTGTYYFGFRNNSPANATGTHAVFVDNFTVSTTLGVNDVLLNKFMVYPNPVNDVISVSNAENILVNGITITDLNGRIVLNNKYEAVSNIQINVSDLAAGVYMMTINSDKGSSVKKIVKE